MKTRNLLSTLVLAASISVPLLVTNTATAGEREYNRGGYEHGYRDGYRDSSDDERHYRPRRHGYNNYGYSPHVGIALGYGGHGGGHGGGYGGGHGGGYGGGHGGGHSSLGFLFSF